MKFVKFFTPCPGFDRGKFVSMLRLDMNIRAQAVEGGVVLDLDAFRSFPPYRMPHWAWLNRADILSPLHTRPASPDEWPELNPQRHYLLGIVVERDCLGVESGDSLLYMMKQADATAQAYQDEPGFCSAVILDRETGEIMYTAN